MLQDQPRISFQDKKLQTDTQCHQYPKPVDSPNHPIVFKNNRLTLLFNFVICDLNLMKYGRCHHLVFEFIHLAIYRLRCFSHCITVVKYLVILYPGKRPFENCSHKFVRFVKIAHASCDASVYDAGNQYVVKMYKDTKLAYFEMNSFNRRIGN